MKRYVSKMTAERIVSTEPTVQHPNSYRNLQNHPPVRGNIADPSPLVAESLHLFCESGPKRILDVGAAAGVDSIYLAAHGHKVTALDKNGAILEWAREKARELGVPSDNFTPRQQDILELPRDERYDVVLANMSLHCLPALDAARAIHVIRDATVAGGFNVLSAYTEENPPEEISKRGLNYLFKSGEISGYYSQARWLKIRDEEGLSPLVFDRSAYLGVEGATFVVPTICELIAQKRVHGPVPALELDPYGNIT